MNATPRLRPSAILAGLALAAAAGSAHAQANFVERFDDVGAPSYAIPASLLQRGWIFRNQSQPLGSRSYFPGILPSTNSIYFWPQEGAGYLAVDGGTTDNSFGGDMSAWAILPPVSNMQAGDVVTIWLRALGSAPANLEVRHSTGGTGTGSGASAVGDFTQVVFAAAPVPSGGWTRYQAPVPGPGRIALRFHGQHGGIGSSNPYIGIDTLSIGPPPPPPCNQPPIPAPGQAVTWTLGGSPYRICQNIAIPEGGTVNIEPGVVVNIDQDRQVAVAGTMNIGGTAAAPVIFSGVNVFPPFVRITGTMNAHFADFRQQVRIAPGANVHLYDCTFTGNGTGLSGGMLLSDQNLGQPPAFVRLERCIFTQTFCTLNDCFVVLRGNTFNATSPWFLRGYADVTSAAAPNVLTGGQFTITREESIQPMRLDGINASGVNSGGIAISGGNYLLGPAVTLQNNLYPLSLSGGLMPGSTVPLTGNTLNVINVENGSFAGAGRWTDLGIPYRIVQSSGSLPGGDLTIDPGVEVQAAPGVQFIFRSTRRLIADGLPGAPIIFRAAAPGQNWQGLLFQTNSSEGPRLEYCTIRDAGIGVLSSDNLLYIENSRFEGNSIGSTAGSFGTAVHAGNRFHGNATALTNRGQFIASPDRPSTISGNSIGIEATSTSASMNAAHVWWGSPTGPAHPSNPGGTGDAITGPGASLVNYQPFLTAAPDHGDHPPVVRMLEPGLRWRYGTDSFLRPGDKIIISWEAFDDSALVSQQILFSPDGHFPDRFTLIADNLPADQRSFEWTIPNPGFAITNQPQFLRIVATDDAGQQGWDQTPLVVSSAQTTGNLAMTTNHSGQTFTAGTPFPAASFSGSASGLPSIDVFLLLEADGAMIPAYHVASGQALFFGTLPMVSTDAARLAIRARNNSNDQTWFFADHWFSIRHDPRLNFVPPQVQLVAPAAGASLPGGSIVPIAWTASASEGLYGFDIQASFNGGRTWHLIARELPAAARSFDWQLPPSTGIADLRLRIIARDLRFQNSSAGMDRIFSITPGSGPHPCYANCDGSTIQPILNVDDFTCFINEFAQAQTLPQPQQITHYANCDGSTIAPVLNVDDFTCFINEFAQGCP
jgi:hypothetical protein